MWTEACVMFMWQIIFRLFRIAEIKSSDTDRDWVRFGELYSQLHAEMDHIVDSVTAEIDR
jgi:hypothetical protein